MVECQLLQSEKCPITPAYPHPPKFQPDIYMTAGPSRLLSAGYGGQTPGTAHKKVTSAPGERAEESIVQRATHPSFPPTVAHSRRTPN